MKSIPGFAMIAIFAVLFAYGAPVGAQIQTRSWAAVGSTCQPDDDAPYTRYEIYPSSGYTEFKSDITGNNYFTCNVTSPVDEYPDEPDWNEMVLTSKDPDANGFVQATLYRKNLSTGAVGSVATVTSTDGTGIREAAVAIPTLDFDNYAYFVRIRMYRSNAASDQELHIVRLRFILL